MSCLQIISAAPDYLCVKCLPRFYYQRCNAFYFVSIIITVIIDIKIQNAIGNEVEDFRYKIWSLFYGGTNLILNSKFKTEIDVVNLIILVYIEFVDR